jgi:hypothetical protein
MIYQLPNGKTVYISLEEFLNLTDEDVQYLVSTGHGSEPISPFHGSALSKPSQTEDVEIEPHDKSIDYKTETDSTSTEKPIDLDNLPDQDI